LSHRARARTPPYSSQKETRRLHDFCIERG
jgi:hypothetical protein